MIERIVYMIKVERNIIFIAGDNSSSVFGNHFLK
jgi:hypothetical protein